MLPEELYMNCDVVLVLVSPHLAGNHSLIVVMVGGGLIIDLKIGAARRVRSGHSPMRAGLSPGCVERI